MVINANEKKSGQGWTGDRKNRNILIKKSEKCKKNIQKNSNLL